MRDHLHAIHQTISLTKTKKNSMKYNVKKAWITRGSILCSIALIVLLIACDDLDDSGPSQIPVAFVSLYHGSPDAPDLAVVVDNRNVFNKFEYTDYSGYLNFYTGNRNFKFNPFNASNALVDTTLNFVEGKTYSVFVIDRVSSLEALLVRDSAAAPASGKAMVRFVHLSPDAPAVSLSVEGETGTPLFGDQSFKVASPFKEVSAKSYSFAVKAAGNNTALLTIPDITFHSGKYYTVIIRGFATPPAGNNNALSAQVVSNE
jgi:hypothetical protein